MVSMMSSMLTFHAAVEMVLNPRATVKHTIQPIYDFELLDKYDTSLILINVHVFPQDLNIQIQ